MKIQENLHWLALAAFWIIFGIACLIRGDITLVILATGGLAGAILEGRAAAVQRDRIRYLKATIANLEHSLKEAHRRDRR